MASRKKCRHSGKVKFDTHERALTRGGKIMEQDPSVKHLRAYSCQHCGHYHLTSQ